MKNLKLVVFISSFVLSLSAFGFLGETSATPAKSEVKIPNGSAVEFIPNANNMLVLVGGVENQFINGYNTSHPVIIKSGINGGMALLGELSPMPEKELSAAKDKSGSFLEVGTSSSF